MQLNMLPKSCYDCVHADQYESSIMLFVMLVEIPSTCVSIPFVPMLYMIMSDMFFVSLTLGLALDKALLRYLRDHCSSKSNDVYLTVWMMFDHFSL